MTTSYLPMWDAQQIIRMHEPAAVVATVRDRFAQWRDIAIARGDHEPTTYRRSQCGQCGDDGCRLLEAARYFQAVVSPFLAADAAPAAGGYRLAERGRTTVDTEGEGRACIP